MTDKLSGSLTSRRVFRTVLHGIALVLVVAAIFLGGMVYQALLSSPAPSNGDYRLLEEVDALLTKNFLGKLPDRQTRIHGAVQGLVASLNDPHTFFVGPPQAEIDSNRLAGSFGGIGAEISRKNDGTFYVSRVYRGGPAEHAGLAEGDELVSIDGKSVAVSDPNDSNVQSALSGDVGSVVDLEIRRAGTIVGLKITRAEVSIPTTFWQPVEGEPLIGSIEITNFSDHTPAELKQAIAELSSGGVEAYIVDLRNNGGGLVDSAIAVVGEFLDGGPVLYERRSDGTEQRFSASRGGSALSQPLAVLVNVNTASAAEIVAGALQDRARAVLIGQKSYGKGTVQVIFALSDGSSLHVTTAEWLTPDHHKIEGVGLTPDVLTVPAEGPDVDMMQAIAYLLGQIQR